MFLCLLGCWVVCLFNRSLPTPETKASELFPCSLLPHWNSMLFFATLSLYDSELNGWSKNWRPCNGEVQTRHGNCNLYVTMLWWRHVRAGAVKFPKKLTWNPTLTSKNTPLFFSHTWGTRFKYLPEGCPTCSCIQIYTSFSGSLTFRCVHSENQTKNFRF